MKGLLNLGWHNTGAVSLEGLLYVSTTSPQMQFFLLVDIIASSLPISNVVFLNFKVMLCSSSRSNPKIRSFISFPSVCTVTPKWRQDVYRIPENAPKHSSGSCCTSSLNCVVTPHPLRRPWRSELSPGLKNLLGSQNGKGSVFEQELYSIRILLLTLCVRSSCLHSAKARITLSLVHSPLHSPFSQPELLLSPILALIQISIVQLLLLLLLHLTSFA